jgi:hypothetical protein
MAAIAVAQQLVDGHDVELWQLDREIRAQASQSMNIEGAAL